VLAASPGNDSYAGRTLIDSVPFAQSVDTTEATSDVDDAEAIAGCGAPTIEASVWYEIPASRCPLSPVAWVAAPKAAQSA
jgi:hypothetical protein